MSKAIQRATTYVLIINILTLSLVFSLFIFKFIGAPSGAPKASSLSSANFNIQQKIVFYNIPQNAIMFTIVGYCHIYLNPEQTELLAVCRAKNKTFKKHRFRLSPQIAYYIEQINGSGTPTKPNISPQPLM